MQLITNTESSAWMYDKIPIISRIEKEGTHFFIFEAYLVETKCWSNVVALFSSEHQIEMKKKILP